MKMTTARQRILVVLIGFLFGSSAVWTFWPESGPPNVVLISIDTLRADYFTPEYMPKTYQWAAENGVIYTNAHSPSTWTRPSHVSMFTGLLPSEHCVETMDDGAVDSLDTIAEKLQRQGYYTVAFIGGPNVSREWNMNQGFKEWHEYRHRGLRNFHKMTFGQYRERYYKTIKGANHWIDAKIGEPFFLFLHIFAVHEYRLMYFEEDLPVTTDVPRTKNWETTARRQWARDIFSSPEVPFTTYPQAVRACDNRLYSFLARLSDKDIIIITSDHGEGFELLGETKSHANIPTPDQTHVPLAITGFGKGRCNSLANISDIGKVMIDRTLPPAQDVVISEHVKEGQRYTAEISATGRQISAEPFDASKNDKVTPSKWLAEELRSLGYLQ